MRTRLYVCFIFIGICLSACNINTPADKNTGKLLIYVGAASKPPVEEIIKLYEEEKGVKVEVVFGGSGFILSQLKLAKKGDIYFPGSSDYMEIAKRDGIVFPETEQRVVYLVNAINVQKGNPKNILSLKDLCRPGLKIAIGNPEGVCVGAYAVEIIEKNMSAEEVTHFRKNLLTLTESCDKTAAVIALSTVDAVIGWSVFEHWNPELIESILLQKEEIVRIGYIPVAISVYTQDSTAAADFIRYVMSEKGKQVFRKYGYFAHVEEAEQYIGEKKSVGGEYQVPENWIN